MRDDLFGLLPTDKWYHLGFSYGRWRPLICALMQTEKYRFAEWSLWGKTLLIVCVIFILLRQPVYNRAIIVIFVQEMIICLASCLKGQAIPPMPTPCGSSVHHVEQLQKYLEIWRMVNFEQIACLWGPYSSLSAIKSTQIYNHTCSLQCKCCCIFFLCNIILVFFMLTCF